MSGFIAGILIGLVADSWWHLLLGLIVVGLFRATMFFIRGAMFRYRSPRPDLLAGDLAATTYWVYRS